MANEDKIQQQQNNSQQAESNAQRDQDHGNMNNGTIGGNMGVVGPNSDEKESANERRLSQEGGATTVPGNSSAGAGNG